MSGAVREYTKYFDLEIPQFDFPGWHVYYDRNIKTVDSILYLMTGTDSLKGTWKNNELYDIGDRVVDIDIAFAYECFVQHTSPPAPTTFAQARDANPDYWHAIDFIQALAGTSATAVTIGLGHKAFVTQSGRIFNEGAKIIINSAANPTVDFMWGSVVSYDGQNLVVDVEVIGGSGIHSDWLISVSGTRGPQGEIGPIGIQGPQGEVGPEGPIGPVGPQGIIAEAPTDGGIYGRKGDTATWTVVAATSATSLPTTPAGSLSSTNVQAALNELDTEKLAKAGGVMTGPITLFGAAHWKWVTGSGAGSYFDSFDTSDRFFVGTDGGTDTFRIFSYGSGSNALAVDGVTGRITVVHPPTLSNQIATKAYVDGLTASVVDITGDTMTGTLTLPALTIRDTYAPINFVVGGIQRWLLRSEPAPGGDFSFHHYDAAGGYLGSALTITNSTGDSTFQQDVIVTRNLRTSGSLAVGANVTTGYSGDGTSILIRAYGAGGIYMQHSSGAAHYARFGHNSSSIYGTLTVDNVLYANAGIDSTGPIWSKNGVVYLSPQGAYLQYIGGNYHFPSGHLYSPAGRLYGTNDFNPATFVPSGGGAIFSTIEGPYYIDMMYPGHSGDYNARLIVHGDHTLQISSSGLSVDNWLNVQTGLTVGGRITADEHIKCKYSGNGYHFNWTGTLEAIIDGGSWGSVLNAHSDYRLKKDVTNLQSMWDVVKALRPVKYTASEWAPYSTADDIERWGFIAHELQATMLPTASTGVKDGTGAPQQPHWPPLIAALCKALQEAMQRIEDLEASSVTG